MQAPLLDDRPMSIARFVFVFLFWHLIISAPAAYAHKEDKPSSVEEDTATSRQDDFEARTQEIEQAISKLVKRTGTSMTRFTFIASAPPTLWSYLPVDFEPTYGIALDLFLNEPAIARGLRNNDLLPFLEKFNIQLAANNDELVWPESAAMVYSMSKAGKEFTNEATMIRSERNVVAPSYSLLDPVDTLHQMKVAITELNQDDPTDRDQYRVKPKLEIKYLVGFSHVAEQAGEVNFPHGIHTTYSFRISDVRLSSDFVRLGQVPEFAALKRFQRREFLR